MRGRLLGKQMSELRWEPLFGEDRGSGGRVERDSMMGERGEGQTVRGRGARRGNVVGSRRREKLVSKMLREIRESFLAGEATRYIESASKTRARA